MAYAQNNIDGLTPQALGSTRSWWDASFTRLLRDSVPLEATQLVEVDCGQAGAAHVLLPGLPEAIYLGVDSDPDRIAEAKALLADAPTLSRRIRIERAEATAIPMGANTADVVLTIMALQNHREAPLVIEDAGRVLRPGGSLVALEPDNLGQRFYFDGVLEKINSAVHDLCCRARVARQPADIAIGPRMPELMRAASFKDIALAAHTIHSTRMDTAERFFRRLHRMARSIAKESGLAADAPCVQAVIEAADRALYSGLPKRLGYSAHTVPIFRCRGVKQH